MSGDGDLPTNGNIPNEVQSVPKPRGQVRAWWTRRRLLTKISLGLLTALALLLAVGGIGAAEDPQSGAPAIDLYRNATAPTQACIADGQANASALANNQPDLPSGSQGVADCGSLADFAIAFGTRETPFNFCTNLGGTDESNNPYFVPSEPLCYEWNSDLQQLGAQVDLSNGDVPWSPDPKGALDELSASYRWAARHPRTLPQAQATSPPTAPVESTIPSNQADSSPTTAALAPPSTAETPTTTVNPCSPTDVQATMSVQSVQQQPYGNGETITLNGTFHNSSGSALNISGFDATVVYVDGSTYDPGISDLIGTGSQQNEQGVTVTVPPNGSAPWSGSIGTPPGQSARSVTLKQVALQTCGTISLTTPVSALVPG